MLARRRAVAAGADDVVLLDHEGNVAEAPIANVFAVKKGVLYTPSLGCVLPGITRDAVLALAMAEGVPVQEATLTRADFVASDEAFLTATSIPIAPIGTIDGRVLSDAPGPVTTRLAARLSAAQHGEDAAFASWLTNVG